MVDLRHVESYILLHCDMKEEEEEEVEIRFTSPAHSHHYGEWGGYGDRFSVRTVMGKGGTQVILMNEKQFGFVVMD